MANYINGVKVISTFKRDGIVIRRCCKCHGEFPLTSEFFHKDKKSVGGFKYRCKKCNTFPDKRHLNKEYKKCPDCGITYPWTNEYFHISNKRWNGLHTICKKCIAIRGKKRYDEIKDTPEYKKQTYNKSRAWLENNDEYARNWRANYYGSKYKNNQEYKLLQLLRQRVRSALKGETKDDTTLALLGCDINYFKIYIESQFTEGMTWDNHGRGSDKWHFDHIRPCASFDLNDPLQQKECFHYTNIQPLWERDNLRKFSNYEGIIYRNKNVNIN